MQREEQEKAWMPREPVRTGIYAIKEVGLTALVILFLLGQKAGWIPDLAADAHERHKVTLEATLSEARSNGVKLDRNELHMLRTQNLELERCIKTKSKEEDRKCLQIFSSTRERLSR